MISINSSKEYLIQPQFQISFHFSAKNYLPPLYRHISEIYSSQNSYPKAFLNTSVISYFLRCQKFAPKTAFHPCLAISIYLGFRPMFSGRLVALTSGDRNGRSDDTAPWALGRGICFPVYMRDTVGHVCHTCQAMWFYGNTGLFTRFGHLYVENSRIGCLLKKELCK